MSLDWNDAKWLARAVLRDRQSRRKWLGRLLVAPLAMLGLGLWVVDEWLALDIRCFVAWWGLCGLVTMVVILFALYDALAVIREERGKSG